MHYAVLRLCDCRLLVVLVERWQLGSRHAPALVDLVQQRFELPTMLVAADDADWRNAKAYAEFDCLKHLYSLIALDNIEWNALPLSEETAAA